MSIYKKLIDASDSSYFEYNFNKITFLTKNLVLKLEKNKLRKEDRDLLIEAVYLLDTIRGM